MKKMKILVFPAGTEIAFEIQNALKYTKFVELFGGNSIPSHAEFVFENCINNIPFVNKENFVAELNSVIDAYEIDFIYPAHDSACLKLTQIQDQLHAVVVTSPLKTVEICRSKNKTYEYLLDKPYTPKHYLEIQNIERYPVFIKPTVGQGSVGAKKIDTEAELVQALSSNIEYAICEYLPGDEYTVDCFTDRNGKLRVARLRRRERIRNGISVRSSLLFTDEEIRTIAEDINSELVFNGAWFFQVKKNYDGKYKLMEISPRIPGTMSVSRNLGINFPLLTIYNMLGIDIEILDNGNEITVDRAFINRFRTNLDFNTVYLDFDDTIYHDGKLYITLIAFLYQCVNKNKRIVLITKHIKNLHQSLSQLRLSETLFDEVIHLKPNDEKSNYISDKDAIFIDDSFSERWKVKQTKGIPVFDLDMVESLLDWRM